MRPRLTMALAVAAIVVGSILLVPAAWGKFAGDRAPADGAGQFSAPRREAAEPTTPPPPTLRAGAVRLSVKGFASWALLDRRTGDIAGSENLDAVSSTESMIKVWIVADYLRREAAAGRTPSAKTRQLAARAVVDSDDAAAQTLYRLGGQDAVVRRLIKTCGLQDTFIGDPGWWSRTQMSARDAVRMGQCVADGRAAGPTWTPWVLDQMRQVRGGTELYTPGERAGGGFWGIVDGLPKEIIDQGVAIKNGWTQIGDDPVRGGPARDNSWHVNCLAVHDEWVLAVLLRYPARSSLEYGAKVCASVAQQLVVRPAA